MKKPLKSEIDVVSLINEIQAQLMALDKKVDTLIQRSQPETRIIPKPTVNNAPLPINSNDHNKGRVMHTVICADCKKECTIPFKPSGDRPVYCKDCFSRRKVIRLSGINIASPQAPVIKEADIPTQKIENKKKAVKVKKPAGKKKPAVKKNKKR